MREVNLNGKQYKISGEIIKRAINPWKAAITSGSREYSSFQNAELQEYHDFRNGIGLESDLPSESNRTLFTEGVDFTTPRSATLGPLVTTAGSFGVAPVKIIDFQGSTYAIGEALIAKWSGSAWDTKFQGITIIEDCEDAWDEYVEPNVTSTADTGDKQVGSASASLSDDGGAAAGDILATEAITSINLAGFTKIKLWFKSQFNRSAGDYQLLLDDTANCVSPLETIDLPELVAGTWTECELTLANPATDLAIISIGIKMVDDPGPAVIKIDSVRATGNTALASPLDAIVVTDATDEYLVVSSATAAIYSSDGSTWLSLVGSKGYLAFYDTKLRGIATDGGTLYSSATNDIDGTWTNFTLSGFFGTVYDLFEGKLLADGTPVLYFCGTEGLYTIDTTNEKAYKQEVQYPPLTYAGHVGIYWNASVWVGTGFGILKVTPSLATFVGPDQDDGLPSTYQGSIFDMVTVNNWLVYCVNKTSSSDKSSIIKRNSSYGGSLQIYTSAADKAIAAIHHSPSSMYTNGRLWFGEDTDIKYMMFPDTTSNVKQVSTYEYVNDSGGSPYSRLPIFRKLAAITKVALGVAAITKSCDANEFIEVFYGLNGAAPTTSLGTFKTSPRPEILTFNSGLGTEFYTIQFAIKLFRGSTDTNSPELESLLFYYLPRPDTINAWTFNVMATDENAEALITAFEAIRDTKLLVPFYPTGDTKKTSYNVALTTMPLRFAVENQQTRKGVIQVSLEEVFSG